jgi:hypothetical protein
VLRRRLCSDACPCRNGVGRIAPGRWRVRGVESCDTPRRRDVREPAPERHAVGPLELPACDRDDPGADHRAPGHEVHKIAGAGIGQSGIPTNDQLVAIYNRANTLGVKISLKVAPALPNATYSNTDPYARRTLSVAKTPVNGGATFTGSVPGTVDRVRFGFTLPRPIEPVKNRKTRTRLRCRRGRERSAVPLAGDDERTLDGEEAGHALRDEVG